MAVYLASNDKSPSLFMQSARHVCPILTKSGFSRQIFGGEKKQISNSTEILIMAATLTHTDRWKERHNEANKLLLLLCQLD